MEETDYMRISFHNNEFVLAPETLDRKPLPDGYTVVMALPPQTKTALSDEFTERTKGTSQSILLTNIVIWKIFATSMQTLFGSIIALQIIGHLPLQNVQLPATSIQIFDILVQIVSFDYFPLTEVWDFGFTPTEPWSLRFVNLQYETVNFIEGLGSIMIFIWLGALFLIIVVTRKVLVKRTRMLEVEDCRSCCCRKNPCANKWVKRFFAPMKAWYNSLDFLQGTFFEIMICLSVGMEIFTYTDYLNSAEN